MSMTELESITTKHRIIDSIHRFNFGSLTPNATYPITIVLEYLQELAKYPKSIYQ